MKHRSDISFLYTNIGRGHPFYLDGLIEAMRKQSGANLSVISRDIFDMSHGLSLTAWRAARWLYQRGAAKGLVGKFYTSLRRETDFNQPSRALQLLGRDVKTELANCPGPLVVAHPLLVGILAGREGLIYQHGELVVPPSALVRGASFVAVPTTEAAEPFLAAGYDKAQMLITGLGIEPQLVAQAEDDYQNRIARLETTRPLTGLFLSSGAEPQQHVAAIVSSVASAIASGGQAVVLCRQGGRLERAMRAAGGRRGPLLSEYDHEAGAMIRQPSCRLAVCNDRTQENQLAAAILSEADYLVAPPHERTNWAVGLGLPMFALKPVIGPFAPLNLKLLLESSTTLVLNDRHDLALFGARLAACHQSGQLIGMARNGWGRYNISGFETLAGQLVDRFSLS